MMPLLRIIRSNRSVIIQPKATSSSPRDLLVVVEVDDGRSIIRGEEFLFLLEDKRCPQE